MSTANINSTGADGPGRLRRGLCHIGRGGRPLVDHPPLPPPSINVQLVKGEVVGLLRKQFDTSDAFKDYGITVADDLTLINTDLNKYDGLATVHTRKGTEKFLEVTVWADPTGAMFYQMNPTSASSLIEAASKEQKPTQCLGWSC